MCCFSRACNTLRDSKWRFASLLSLFLVFRVSAQQCSQVGNSCAPQSLTEYPLKITSGLGSDCIYVHEGRLPCVSTVVSEGSGTYENNAQCLIRTQQALIINAAAFNTESCCDHLSVEGRQYSGTIGPENVRLTEGVTISWSSDASVTSTGWTICATAAYSPLCCAGSTCNDENVRGSGFYQIVPSGFGSPKLSFNEVGECAHTIL